MERANTKIFDELQKALNYHKLEKSNLDYLQEKKQQEEREKLSYQQNIKELNKYIEKEIFPILETTIRDMYKLGQCYVSSHYTGDKVPTTAELDRETLEWLDKNFCGILKEIDVPYNVFLYLDDFHNLSFKIDDVNSSYRLMDIDTENYLNNCGLLTMNKSEIGYLADGKAYDILFANNKRFADIKASVLAYQDVVNETIKSKADALMWALRGDIVSFDNQIANLTKEIGFTDLCNYFEINTGYNDIDDYRQARIYNDKVYILNNKGEVHNDIPIADIVTGNIHTGNIFGNDKLFLSEMIYDVFYQSPYYDEFDKELQDKLDDSSHHNIGWGKDFLNILKDWDKNVENLNEEVFEYYEPLCNWIDTNKILGTKEDYLRFCIKEAESKFIDNIKEYECNKNVEKLDEMER